MAAWEFSSFCKMHKHRHKYMPGCSNKQCHKHQSHSVYILPKNGLLIVCICILNWECILTPQTIYISCISNKNVQNLKSHQLTELRPKISESSEKLVRKRVSGVSRGSRSITQESESTSLMSFLLGSRHKNTNYNRTIASKCKKVL